MSDLTVELNQKLQNIWLDRPDDVSRLIGRNYNTGREFPVWVYSFSYLEALSGILNTYASLARNHEGDLETLKKLASTQTRFYSDSGGDDSEGFRRIAHMEDVSDLLEKAAVEFENVDNYEDFAGLARALQRYILQLHFWVDIEFPWDEVSERLDRYWHQRNEERGGELVIQ